MKKNCVICGKEFETNYSYKITCGDKCSIVNKRRKSASAQKEWLKNPINRLRMTIAQMRWRKDPKNKERINTRRKQRLYADECFRRKELNRAAAWRRNWRKTPAGMKSERKTKSRPEYKSRHLLASMIHHRKNAPISQKTQNFFLSMKLGEAVKQTEQNTMKNQIQKQVPTVQQFIESFTARLKGIEDSCKELALMVDANPNVFDEIVAADARFNYNMLESMRKVGKGELYCELLFDPSMAARKLLPLPAAQQKKLYNEPIKIVKVVGEKKVVEEKPLNKMSRAELNQVIDEDKHRARTVEEQIAYVKPPTPSRRAERYEIIGDRLKVLAETEFTAQQLREILERMDKKSLESLPGKIRGNQLAAS